MKKIRIGTRDSQLAVWQAEEVKKKLKQKGLESELLLIKSTGDLELKKPLYEMGITGVFTKALDLSLIDETIDIAVHSLKDVPTIMPQGIVQGMCLKREESTDVLIYKEGKLHEKGIVATGSLRRKAAWKSKYKEDDTTNLRGNVQLRLEKLMNNPWKGAIFSKAGLDRLKILDNLPKGLEYKVLNWMIPAPAQGIISVSLLEESTDLIEVLKELNHEETRIESVVERAFLQTLEGGCSAPIGAKATMENGQITLKTALYSLSGKQGVFVKGVLKNINEYQHFGKELAKQCLREGGLQIMKELKK